LSYDTLKIEPGRQRIDVIDITLEGCGNVYGTSPCEASLVENRIPYSETLQTWGMVDPLNASITTAVPASYPFGATEAAKIEVIDTPALALLSVRMQSPLTYEARDNARVYFCALSDGITGITVQWQGFSLDFDISAGTHGSVPAGYSVTMTADGAWWQVLIEGPVDAGGPAGAPQIDIVASAPFFMSLGDAFWLTKFSVIYNPFAPAEYVKTGASAIYGTSDQKCFNSWQTCQDPTNYAETDKVFSFCTPVSDTPDGCIPFLDNVKGDSGQLDPENSLGKRGQITVNLMDAPHDDTEIDPYLDERSYSALERGTFWPRFRARFPFYQGRKLEWYQGYYPFARANAKKRTYIIEDLKGWGRTKSITIIAKDPLKLADDKRAQWPRPSTGLLTSTLSAVATPTTMDITTGTATEYDLEDYETTAVVLIGSEIIPYTGTTVITGGVRLTGVGTRGTVGDYVTPVAAHDAGVAVQKCANFSAMKVPRVLQVLLEQGGNVPPSYIDYATWESEYDTWLAGFRVTRLICKPEGVTSIIKELIPQSNTWALWWDNESAKIRYQVVRPLDYDELIETLSDDNHIIAGSLIAQDDSDRLLNQLLVQYGQIDPTKDAKEGTNYREGFVTLDVGSQSAREHGQVFSNTINGRWHGTGNRSELIAIADRLLQARSAVPIRVEFDVDRKDDDAKTGQFVTLDTSAIVDMYGEPKPTIVRIIQQDAGGDTVRYVARQELLATGFARIAPDSYAEGYEYTTATAQEKLRYAFIADSATGLLGGTDPGTRLL